MIEATTNTFTRDALKRAHAERSAAFANIFAAMLGRNKT